MNPVLKNVCEFLGQHVVACETAARQKGQATLALNRSCTDERIGVDKLERYSGRGNLRQLNRLPLSGFILEDRSP